MSLEKKQSSSGAKGYQRTDTENRVKPYSDWHRTLDRSLLMLDVDFIEWRFRGQELVAVGVMEVTRVDMEKEVTKGYLDAIIARYEKRDMQGVAARKVARALNTNAYIILFREDCSRFAVYNLTDNGPWRFFDPEAMEAFLKQL